MTPPAPVRTRNAATTRVAILDAAHRRFIEDGYDQAGLRAIAGDAGVDAAMICRYFGSKEKLFADVLARASSDPMQILGGDRPTFGLRAARAMLDPKERCPQRLAFIALATRSGSSPVASKLVRRHIEQRFILPFSAWLGDERAVEKAWLIASVLLGVGVMSGIHCAQFAGWEETEDAIDRLANLLQTIVDQDDD